METLFLLPGLAGYAAGSAGFVLDRASGTHRWTKYAVLAFGAGALLHGLDLVARGIQAGNIPVATLEQSVSFLAWLTALVGLVLIVRLRMEVVGAYVGPAVTLVAFLAYATMSRGRFELPETLRSVWFPIHVTLAFLGYSMFALAAAMSLVYLVYESRLKAKRSIGLVDRDDPSLEKLDRTNYRLLGWGFFMLSLAIITGAIWADATWGHFWSWEPIESWSLVIWALYAGLLESRLTVGWRGRRAAALTLVVFTLLVGSFLGVSLVFPGKHGGSFG